MTTTNPQQQATRQWRVELGNRADLVVMLRDYLRREGMEADLSGPTSLALETNAPASALRNLLGAWERVTGAPAVLTGDSELRPAPASAPAGPQRPRLGELLVDQKFITEEQATFAVNEARETGSLLGVVLLRQQLIFEDELARTLSKQLDIPYVSVMRVGIDPAVVRLLPREVGEQVYAIPVRIDDAGVVIAFADPTDAGALDAVRDHVPQFQLAVGELSDIKLAWREVGHRVAGRS